VLGEIAKEKRLGYYCHRAYNELGRKSRIYRILRKHFVSKKCILIISVMGVERME
jgi:hypothetical protein